MGVIRRTLSKLFATTRYAAALSSFTAFVDFAADREIGGLQSAAEQSQVMGACEKRRWGEQIASSVAGSLAREAMPLDRVFMPRASVHAAPVDPVAPLDEDALRSTSAALPRASATLPRT